MFFIHLWRMMLTAAAAVIFTCFSVLPVVRGAVTDQGSNSTVSSNTVTLHPPTEAANSTLGDCQVMLANNQTYAAVKTLFKGVSGNGRRAVYITLKVGDFGSERLFDVYGNDTFAPDQWVWATPKGKNLLRMPLDYVILSLGILTMGTANFNISLHESTVDCLKSRNVPYERTVHIVTKFLAENVSGNGTTVEKDSDDPVICRSAYAFTHQIFVDRGIGYKCCSSPESPDDVYRCETPYTISWEMVWYGPVVLLCWVYAIFIVHFYKLYRRSFNLKKMRELSGLRKTLNEIKSDMANRIVRMSEDIARIRTPDDLIALREKSGFLDVLGVDKSRQSRITAVSRVLFTLLMFSMYYVACGVFLYEYRLQLGAAFQHLKDSGAVYLNILGHLGWVFCDMSLGLSRYAIFELVCTLLMPFFALIVYFAINYRQETIDFAASKKRVEASQEPQRTILNPGVHIQKLFMPAVTGVKRLFFRFLISGCGKVVQGISFTLFFLYVVLIAGVFVTYVVYFVGLGVFANLDVISPYIIPMVVCFTFFTHSFSPAYYQYRIIKDTIFSICLERESRLIIKKHKEIFLKREIVDNFYVPNSRSTIYNCVLRILVVIAFMLLVILVILTLQYPYYFQMDSIVSFLGVQVVFFLPLLSGLVNNNNQFSALEETILQRDLKAYIEQYEEDHPEAPAVVEEANGTTPGGSEDSAMENDDDGMYELGELGFGSPVADPVMKSASDVMINIKNNRSSHV